MVEQLVAANRLPARGMTACEACPAAKAPTVRLKPVMPDTTTLEFACAHRPVSLFNLLDTAPPLSI
jgi:hypothetical protein